MLRHSMKYPLGAMAMTISLAVASGAVAQPSLDERLGCGLMLVSIDEMVKTYPSLAAQVSKNGQAATGMLRMLAASGATLFDAASLEAAGQGMSPAVIHRRSLAHVTRAFAGLKGPNDPEANARFMTLLDRCITAAAPPA